MIDQERFTAIVEVHGKMHRAITVTGARFFVQRLRDEAHYYPRILHLKSCFSASCLCGYPKLGEAKWCARCTAWKLAQQEWEARYAEQTRLEDEAALRVTR